MTNIQRNKEGSATRAREYEVKHPKEWSVKRTRDEVSSAMTMECFRARETRRVGTTDAVEWPLSGVKSYLRPIVFFF